MPPVKRERFEKLRVQHLELIRSLNAAGGDVQNPEDVATWMAISDLVKEMPESEKLKVVSFFIDRIARRGSEVPHSKDEDYRTAVDTLVEYALHERFSIPLFVVGA